MAQKAQCAQALDALRLRVLAARKAIQDTRQVLEHQQAKNGELRAKIAASEALQAMHTQVASSSSRSFAAPSEASRSGLHVARAQLLRGVAHFLRLPPAKGTRRGVYCGELNLSTITGLSASTVEDFNAGLGQIALFVSKASDLLGVPLSYPLHPCGSTSAISGPKRQYPLYISDRPGAPVATAPIRSALRALNCDIRQLCHAHGVRVTAPDGGLLFVQALELLCSWERLMDATQPVHSWIFVAPGNPLPVVSSSPTPAATPRSSRALLPRYEDLAVDWPGFKSSSGMWGSQSDCFDGGASAELSHSHSTSSLPSERRGSRGPSLLSSGSSHRASSILTSSVATSPTLRPTPTTTTPSGPAAARPEGEDDDFVLV
eukprot:EG_transcript_9626